MRVYKRSDSKKWWGAFEIDGLPPFQFSTQIENDGTKKSEKAALEVVAARRQRYIADKNGTAPKQKVTAERTTVGHLLDALAADYEERDVLTDANRSVIELTRNAFGRQWADTLTDESLKDYRKEMRRQGYADATIKNRLQVLDQALALAKLPKLAMPDLNLKNARDGWFSDAQMDELLAHLPDDGLRDFVEFGYLIGWRKEAISTLTWNDVEDGSICLRWYHSKNGVPYRVPFEDVHPDLAALMERRRKARSIKDRDGNTTLCKYVFHRDGEPIYEFRKSWQTACMRVGLGFMRCPKCKAEGTDKRCKLCKVQCEWQGQIFHDLRRSAARNLVRSGVPIPVAMRITGHETEAMFLRYNITDDEDLRDAMVKVAARRKEERGKLQTMRKAK